MDTVSLNLPEPSHQHSGGTQQDEPENLKTIPSTDTTNDRITGSQVLRPEGAQGAATPDDKEAYSQNGQSCSVISTYNQQSNNHSKQSAFYQPMLMWYCIHVPILIDYHEWFWYSQVFQPMYPHVGQLMHTYDQINDKARYIFVASYNEYDGLYRCYALYTYGGNGPPEEKMDEHMSAYSLEEARASDSSPDLEFVEDDGKPFYLLHKSWLKGSETILLRECDFYGPRPGRTILMTDQSQFEMFRKVDWLFENGKHKWY